MQTDLDIISMNLCILTVLKDTQSVNTAHQLSFLLSSKSQKTPS